MNAVNAVILDADAVEVALIPELAGHLIAGGGKRMRPMLTLACAALLDYPGTRHHKLAAAVEFIHTATLLHDDVVDGSGLRRGKRTANIIWGNPASVLVGDFLFSRAFELMVEDGSLKVLKILSHASAVIAEGEVNQLTAQRRIETSEDHYLDIISAKTAALFAAACRIAAVVAEARRGGRGSARRLWPQSRHRLPAGRRRDRLCVGRGDDGQGRGRRFPRRQGHPAGHPRLCARRRGGPRLLAGGDGRATVRPTRISPTPPACSATPARSTTRSSAPATTASARSTRSAPSPPAGPRRRWSKRSNSRSPALIDPLNCGSCSPGLGLFAMRKTLLHTIALATFSSAPPLTLRR